MNMTIENIKEFKRNAIEILRKNSQYATAKATETAFDLLIWTKEIEEKLEEARDSIAAKFDFKR